jgi:hypothetical protein
MFMGFMSYPVTSYSSLVSDKKIAVGGIVYCGNAKKYSI